MPQIPWKTILKILNEALKDNVGRRNDPKFWTAEFKPEEEGDKTKAVVKSVRMEATTGLRLELDKGGKTVVIEARPSSIQKTKVFVDGAADADATMVFDFKGSFGNPTRYAFDFKNVTLEGDDYRVDTRFDP